MYKKQKFNSKFTDFHPLTILPTERGPGVGSACMLTVVLHIANGRSVMLRRQRSTLTNWSRAEGTGSQWRSNVSERYWRSIRRTNILRIESSARQCPQVEGDRLVGIQPCDLAGNHDDWVAVHKHIVLGVRAYDEAIPDRCVVPVVSNGVLRIMISR